MCNLYTETISFKLVLLQDIEAVLNSDKDCLTGRQ